MKAKKSDKKSWYLVIREHKPNCFSSLAIATTKKEAITRAKKEEAYEPHPVIVEKHTTETVYRTRSK